MAYSSLSPSYSAHSPYSSTSSSSFNVPSPIEASFDTATAADHHRQVTENAYHTPSEPQMSTSYQHVSHSQAMQQQQDMSQEFTYAPSMSSIYPDWSHLDKRQPYVPQQQHRQQPQPPPTPSHPVLSVYIPPPQPQHQQASPAVIHSPAPLPAPRHAPVLQADLPDWTSDMLGYTPSRPKQNTSTFYTTTGHYSSAYQIPPQHHYQSSSSSSLIPPPQLSGGPMPIFNLSSQSSSHLSTYYTPLQHGTTHSPPPMSRPTELSPMTIDAARYIRPSEVSPSALSPPYTSSSSHSRSESGDSQSPFDDAYDACYDEKGGMQMEAFDPTVESAEYDTAATVNEIGSATSSVTSDSDVDAEGDEDYDASLHTTGINFSSEAAVRESYLHEEQDEDDDEEEYDYEDKTDGDFSIRGSRRGSVASSSSSLRLSRRRAESDSRYSPYDYHSPTTDQSAAQSIRTRRSTSNAATSVTSGSHSPSTTIPNSEKPRPRPQTILPTPIPVPNLTKKSRGRRVPTASSQELRKAVAVQDPYVGSSSRGRGSKGSRTHLCKVPGCGKCFARGEHLKRHVRSIHTHEKPHKCPYPGCDKDFSRYDNLGQHMRVHKDWSP